MFPLNARFPFRTGLHNPDRFLFKFSYAPLHFHIPYISFSVHNKADVDGAADAFFQRFFRVHQVLCNIVIEGIYIIRSLEPGHLFNDIKYR